MAKDYKRQWACKSSSGNGRYIVSEDFNGVWSCSCRGWTSHVPRTDCKHIREVKAGGGDTFGDAALDILSGRDRDR